MGGVVVTGALGALGRATVTSLKARGYQVAAIDLKSDRSDADVFIGGVDLTDEAAVATAFAQAADNLESLDALVNVAGGFRWETIEAGSIESWDLMYQINLRTAAIASRAILPHLTAGAIVNVGAAAASAPGLGMASYAASKAGVMALTESLADELKARGIRVNAVLPTILNTPANRQDIPDADPNSWVSPEDAAAAIAFLISADAAAITGVGIKLSLGRSVH